MQYQRKALQKLHGYWLSLISFLILSKCLGSLIMELFSTGESLFNVLFSALLSVFLVAIFEISFNFASWNVVNNKYPSLGLLFKGFKNQYYSVLVEINFIKFIFIGICTFLCSLAYVSKFGIVKLIQYNLNFGNLLIKVVSQITNGQINYSLLSLATLICCVMLILELFIGAYFNLLFFAKISNPIWSLKDIFIRTYNSMHNNWWNLIKLQLSFIPWYLTCLFTFSITLIFVIPFNQVALAIFYKDLK